MEFENLLTLIKTVSDSSLTGFKYEENNVKVSMQKEQVQVVTTAGITAGTAAQFADGNMQSGMALNQTVQPAMQAASQASAESAGEAGIPQGQVVKSPLVGTFYAAPSEDAAPFVSVGDTVKKGQVLAIVEAMKLMNDIESDFDGVVSEIYVQNAEAVEYGQPLFRIS